MNFSMTFSDRIGLKSASAEEKARAAVIRTIYDAIRYDCDFRKESLMMLNEKRYGELQPMLKELLVNEAARLLSDAVDYATEPGSSKGLAGKIGALMSAQSAGEDAGDLGSALGMLGNDRLDLIACYKEAYSRFDIEMGLYRELKRGSGISARPRTSEA